MYLSIIRLSESASIEGDAGGDVGRVVKVYFRGDTAANQQDLLRYCPKGKNDRFGVINFAVGVDVTAEFKRAVSEVEEGEWQSLDREVDGQRVKTEQE